MSISVDTLERLRFAPCSVIIITMSPWFGRVRLLLRVLRRYKSAFFDPQGLVHRKPKLSFLCREPRDVKESVPFKPRFCQKIALHALPTAGTSAFVHFCFCCLFFAVTSSFSCIITIFFYFLFLLHHLPFLPLFFFRSFFKENNNNIKWHLLEQWNGVCLC